MENKWKGLKVYGSKSLEAADSIGIRKRNLYGSSDMRSDIYRFRDLDFRSLYADWFLYSGKKPVLLPWMQKKAGYEVPAEKRFLLSVLQGEASIGFSCQFDSEDRKNSADVVYLFQSPKEKGNVLAWICFGKKN